MASSSSVAVRARSAVAFVNRFPVLSGVNLDVAPGEVVLLEGANGAGKTSLLRACAGLLSLTSGELHVLGHDITRDARAVRGGIAYLAHDAALYDELTVAENLRFFARAIGHSADPAALIDRVGLPSRLANVIAGQLSAGQRRRVGLASVVLRDAPLWLLDEPHAGLDAGGRELLHSLVVDAAQRGTTILFASHEADVAREIATRSVAISGGRVLGTPIEAEVADPKEPAHVG